MSTIRLTIEISNDHHPVKLSARLLSQLGELAAEAICAHEDISENPVTCISEELIPHGK